eukprot:TRINITY_DN14757_c0_g1_i1.p2 TRINITY_DN14757_c0_g1~~TRINITY_DN14757_c0_g1_i1.p2  ORF type:complete len:244 (-),score=32.48 TRINITY_DN14757_c0_g1_i1:20-751(-)
MALPRQPPALQQAILWLDAFISDSRVLHDTEFSVKTRLSGEQNKYLRFLEQRGGTGCSVKVMEDLDPAGNLLRLGLIIVAAPAAMQTLHTYATGLLHKVSTQWEEYIKSPDRVAAAALPRKQTRKRPTFEHFEADWDYLDPSAWPAETVTTYIWGPKDMGEEPLAIHTATAPSPATYLASMPAAVSADSATQAAFAAFGGYSMLPITWLGASGWGGAALSGWMNPTSVPVPAGEPPKKSARKS